MEIVCETCKAKLNIPDEKIPKGLAVRIACPKCKNKIVLEMQKPAAPGAGSESEDASDTGNFGPRFVEPKPGTKPAEGSYGYEDYTGDASLQFFEEGTRLALVMANTAERGETISKAVEGIGYKAISTPNTRDAIGKTRFHHFDMVILMDGFDGQPLERCGMVNYLNRLNMSVRRRIFVALMSDNFKTMDDMMAFALSANVVINTKDLEKLPPILKKAVSDNEKFYKVFIDTLAETGRA
jgi:DNA-directed RNA polymerase subunit RPC12/RpoP